MRLRAEAHPPVGDGGERWKGEQRRPTFAGVAAELQGDDDAHGIGTTAGQVTFMEREIRVCRKKGASYICYTDI